MHYDSSIDWSALTRPLRLSWRQLYRQFGLDPDKASDKRTAQNFRRKVLREMKKIKSPSTPAILPLSTFVTARRRWFMTSGKDLRHAHRAHQSP